LPKLLSNITEYTYFESVYSHYSLSAFIKARYALVADVGLSVLKTKHVDP